MCKSCNYPALRGEVRVNYTPVGQAESMRRQVELLACLCNRGECEEWQTAAFTEVHRQEGAIAQFTLFSNKLQEPIVWSDTHDQWHNVSQTLKRSCGAVCTPIERCASSVSFTVLHSPPKYVNTLAIKGFLFRFIPEHLERFCIWKNRGLFMFDCPLDLALCTYVSILSVTQI